MNSKMTTNLQLSTTEPEKQKQNQTKQTITEMEITWRVISGDGVEGEWGKGTGNMKHKW